MKKQTFGLEYSHASKKEIKSYDSFVKEFDVLDNFIFEFVPFNKTYEGKYTQDLEDDFAKIDQFVGNVSQSF
jgi:hypothetical protein